MTQRPSSGHGRRATNILLTCSDDVGHGGVQVVFRDLVRSLEAAGRRVHLLYAGPTARPWLSQAENSWGRRAFYCPLPTIVRGSLLLSLPLAVVFFPLALFHLVRLLRRHKVDVVNAHYLAEYFLHLVIAARLLRVPIVVSVHGADVDRYARVRPAQRLLLRLIVRGADRIVACSAAMAEQTARVFPRARAKITHVHNGLVLEDLAAPTTPAVTPATPFVLSVCRQVAKKGTDTLLRAFEQVHRQMPHVGLVVIGDGPELDKHRALAESLGIERAVSFLGDRSRDEILPFFSACSLFVLPSRAEPFGLVLLEAAYYQRPIVCTAVGGVPEIITDGVNGFVVPPDDPETMATKIATLLRDPGLGARFGVHAYETLMTRFRWEHRVQDYLAVYEADEKRAAVSQGHAKATVG